MVRVHATGGRNSNSCQCWLYSHNINLSKGVTIKSEVRSYKLFAYGTLNVHAVQRSLWGEAKTGTPFVLDDHELKMYANNIFYIERKLGERVSGKLYDLTPEQWEATDWYEGESYTKTRVTQGGDIVLTYVQAKA